MKLTEQTCAACSGTTQPFTHDEASQLGMQIPNWTIADDKIERTFEFPNFVEAMRFANEITKIAEEENHHPDLHISWGKVSVELTTHNINGLSQNDFIVAAKIDKLMDDDDSRQSM